MKLYNTLSRQLEEFKPQSQSSVKLYSCGPTVYDYAHIGNLRAYVFVDTLRRSLEASGYGVKHVMNITDVGHLASDGDAGDDKLETGAKRENKDVWEVARHFTEAFKSDAGVLNILPPNGYRNEKTGDPYARATDFIAAQLELIQLLVDKGFAYKTEEAVYFDVSKLSSYGSLTNQKLADKDVGARPEVVTDEAKRHPQDFALWFFTVGRFKDHVMRWESKWGEGFPGWHLECSAIVHTTLSEPVDIHTGGVDHVGTHHTNEIAQTEAGYGQNLANVWLHNEHILVDGGKMSKSSGNFITLQDVKDKGYDPMALRLLFLQSHYRSQANFTWDALSAAAKFLGKLRAAADLALQDSTVSDKSFLGDTMPVQKRITELLGSDLNTPDALAELALFINKANSNYIGRADISALEGFLSFLDQVFGLDLSHREGIGQELKAALSERESARKNQQWDRAEELKELLIAKGIAVRDTQHGPIWSRVI